MIGTQERIERVSKHRDFYRLARGLTAMKIDFDYSKTRKLLDPKWDGYNIGQMDVIDDDCDINEANLLTSKMRDSDLHKPVLDLDYGARFIDSGILNELQLTMNRPTWIMMDKALLGALNAAGILTYPMSNPPQIQRFPDGNGQLNIRTSRDLALIPSSTPGHHHLIIDIELTWHDYIELVHVLSMSGIIEPGYYKASEHKGYSAIRPPWIRK